MILPTKHIRPHHSLLGVAAEILVALRRRRRTVSALWDELRKDRPGGPPAYGSFVLALDLLYLLGTVELEGSMLCRSKP